MTRALSGIRVIDCTQWIQGPVSGLILGDLGADVIKIEERSRGDPARGYQEISKSTVIPIQRNFVIDACNLNKRSLNLDLRKVNGKEIIYKLIETADVFIHNFATHVPEGLGIGYDTLSCYNAKLIYAELSGYGSRGPLKSEPAYEQAAMARAGMTYLIGEPDSPPGIWVSGVGDQIAGTTAALAIMAALVARERQGIGQKLELSLLGSMVWAAMGPISMKLMTGEEFPRRSRSKPPNPLINNYECSDGKWINLIHMQPDRYWSTLCKALGIEELEEDPRFKDMEVRGKHTEELVSILDKHFISKSSDEWFKIFRETGELIYGPVQTISEVINDPQVLANDYIVDFDDPVWGPGKVVGFPCQFSETPPSIERRAPEFGEHTEEILLELGYSWGEILSLKDQQVI